MEYLILAFLLSGVPASFYLGPLEERFQTQRYYRPLAWLTLIGFVTPPFLTFTFFVGLFYPPVIIVLAASPLGLAFFSRRLEKRPRLRRFLAITTFWVAVIVLIADLQTLAQGRLWMQFRM